AHKDFADYHRKRARQPTINELCHAEAMRGFDSELQSNGIQLSVHVYRCLQNVQPATGGAYTSTAPRAPDASTTAGLAPGGELDEVARDEAALRSQHPAGHLRRESRVRVSL